MTSMIAYACGSGGVMFVPEEIERTMPRVKIRRSNDNKGKEPTGSALTAKEKDQE